MNDESFKLIMSIVILIASSFTLFFMADKRGELIPVLFGWIIGFSLARIITW